MLREAREDDAKPDPEADVLINMDKAGEFVSEEFSGALEAAGVRTRFKKPGREQKNALAMVDSAMGKFARILFRYARNAADQEAQRRLGRLMGE